MTLSILDADADQWRWFVVGIDSLQQQYFDLSQPVRQRSTRVRGWPGCPYHGHRNSHQRAMSLRRAGTSAPRLPSAGGLRCCRGGRVRLDRLLTQPGERGNLPATNGVEHDSYALDGWGGIEKTGPSPREACTRLP